MVPPAWRRLWGIDDETWFDLQLRPADARRKYGIPLPELPPDEVQLAFTARAGYVNLQQAFSFYRYVRSVCRLGRRPTILDLGAGWGRIARFFLRDTKPQRIVVVDCMSEAIRWLHATRNPCRIIANEAMPPIAGLDTSFDLIYAFSVFSHLSEPALHAWITYLFEALRAPGYLVFTTRGFQFIDQLEELHRDGGSAHARLRESLPLPPELRARHERGEFQFYPIGGAGELTPDFYGETFIPRSYLERHYGSALVDFREDVPHVDQSVVVLKKDRPGRSLAAAAR
jgi:hypothetical protein